MQKKPLPVGRSPTKMDIERKRNEVRAAYSQRGFHSKEYQQSFDELHDMNLLYMATSFRAERGLPPSAKTPYCPTHRESSRA